MPYSTSPDAAPSSLSGRHRVPAPHTRWSAGQAGTCGSGAGWLVSVGGLAAACTGHATSTPCGAGSVLSAGPVRSPGKRACRIGEDQRYAAADEVGEARAWGDVTGILEGHRRASRVPRASGGSRRNRIAPTATAGDLTTAAPPGQRRCLVQGDCLGSSSRLVVCSERLDEK